jgi:magnesium chelatase family protein
VPALQEAKFTSALNGESSDTIKNRLNIARNRKSERQGKANFLLSSKEINTFCTPNEAGLNLLKMAIGKNNPSARAYHRILKVARSIADLAASDQVETQHIAEAEQYRRNDITN